MIYGLTQPHIFKGHYELRVLRGAVSLGGVTLKASPHPVRVSSPAPPYYALKPQFTADSTDLLDQPGEFDGVACVVDLQPLELSHLAAIAPPFKSLFEPMAHLSNETDQSLLWTPLPGWQDAATLSNGDTLVIVGPKNSGKSSLARYALNLNELDSVYLLDLDPGQCEVTPPGTLSLSRVKTKDFGASYLGTKWDIVKAHSLGYNSPIACPSRYMDLVFSLFEEIPVGATVVVNTPGWTKGLGLELVSAIIQGFKPTRAVHMGQDESYEALQEQLHPHIMLKICDPVVSTGPAKFSASDLRNLQMVAYFHKDRPQHITEWAPFELLLDPDNTDGSAIKALALFEPYGIDRADMSICFEGTIVAIHQLTDNILTDGTVVTAPEQLHTVSKWLGYGIVQRMRNETIRLLTPLDPETVSGPIVLARGRLDLPIFLAWNGQGEGPWLIAKNPPGVGSVYTKFRRNIGRN